ncbi:type II toxin-antitoxin system RelE/ParE family toxin [Allomuricauda sp. d1]|uniref:type II toxin-antitoxin system RelE/ParE family toxin n=1 Tax=Allomuricauda sp. d1 TaxID=3136725 RepID=UPI0031DC2AD2
MPKAKYVISARAKSDIKSIATYTVENFGESQALKYAQGLKTILRELANDPELGKRYVAVKNQMLLKYRYKSHVIFYHKKDTGIFIVRVLGGRMDFPKHLK